MKNFIENHVIVVRDSWKISSLQKNSGSGRIFILSFGKFRFRPELYFVVSVHLLWLIFIG